MRVLNQLTKKNTNCTNKSNMPAMLFIGSLIGGLGAYMFFTEKGANLRKKAAEKLGGLSGLFSEAQEQQDDIFNQSAGNSDDGEEAVAMSKAHNMVNHLKHKNGNSTAGS